jgi:hypothetical protein
MLPGVAVGSVAAAAVAVFLAVLAIKSTSTAIHYGAPALLGGVAVWMFFSERYERTLAVLALYLGLFDGFLKLKTGSTIATLGRDVLLYAIAAGALVRLIIRRRPVHIPKLSVAVLVWVIICFAEVLNPVVPSITHALAGVRQHIEFVPLFVLGYVVMRSERRLMGLCVLLVVVAAANGIVALVQSRLSLAAFASWGPGYARQVYGATTVTARTFYDASGVEHVRPPALGSDLGFGGLVGLLAAPAIFALGSMWGRSRRAVVVAIVGAPFVLLALTTSQSRTAVVGAVVAILTYLFLTATTKKGAQMIAVATVIGVVAYVAFPLVFPTAASQPNRYASIAPTSVISTAVAYRSGTLSLVPRYMLDYPLGAGIGDNGPAAGSTVGGSALAYSQNAESEFNFLVLEVGIPGLLLLTALTATVIGLGIRLRRIPDPSIQRLLMVLVAANVGIAATWFAGIATATSPQAPFFWFTAGAIVYWFERVGPGSRPTTPIATGGRAGRDAHSL